MTERERGREREKTDRERERERERERKLTERDQGKQLFDPYTIIHN